MKTKALLVVVSILAVSTQVSGQVVINELDYDQPGTDTAEFVELFNGSIVSVDLSSYMLELINGSGGGAVIDESIALTGSIPSFGYYVVCQDVLTVPNCDQESISSFQNGAPDAVGLRDGTLALVDAVSYEGDTGAPYTEGTGTSAADNNNDELVGLSRSPASLDTNNNDADFSLRCTTAGQVNSLATTGCDTLPVELGEVRLLMGQNHLSVIWTTLSEVSMDGFEIQELIDGAYSARGFVEAVGVPSKYSFKMDRSEPGIRKFRIRIVNADGSSQYSDEVEGDAGFDGSLILSDAYPNPFTTSAEFEVHTGVSQRVVVTFYDILGRSRATLLDEVLGPDDSRTINIHGSGLPSGLYFYRVVGTRSSITKTVLLR